MMRDVKRSVTAADGQAQDVSISIGGPTKNPGMRICVAPINTTTANQAYVLWSKEVMMFCRTAVQCSSPFRRMSRQCERGATTVRPSTITNSRERVKKKDEGVTACAVARSSR